MGIGGKYSYRPPPPPQLTPFWNQRQVFGAPAGVFVGSSDALSPTELAFLQTHNFTGNALFVQPPPEVKTTGLPSVVSDKEQLAQLKSSYDVIALHAPNYDSNRERGQPSFAELGSQLASFQKKVDAETPKVVTTTLPIASPKVDAETPKVVTTTLPITSPQSPTVSSISSPVKIFPSSSSLLLLIAVVAIFVGVVLG